MKVQIRPFEEPQLAALLAFRRRMYPENPAAGDERFLRWRMLAHPWAPGPALLAWRGEEVVGSWLGLAERLSSPTGEIEAAWLIDLAVLPEHRDSMAAMLLFREAARVGLPLLAIGVPEELLSFYKVFRWQRRAVADTFYCALRPGPTLRFARHPRANHLALPLADALLPLAHRLRLGAAPRPAPRLEPAVGAEYDDFWARTAPRLGVAGRRDAAWLRWKVFERPHGQDELWSLRDRAGALRGWVALRPRRRVGQADWLDVVELLVDPEDGAAFDALVDQALRRALAWRAAFVRLRCALPAQTARLRPPLWQRRVRTPIEDLFLLPGPRSEATRALEARPWHLSLGASDSVETGLDEWPRPAKRPPCP